MQAREVLRPPLWLMALYAFFFGSCVFAIWAAFDIRATALSSALSAVALIWIWRASPLRISIEEELRVGMAHLEYDYIERVVIVDATAMKALRTRDADPAAFLALRFWCPTGMKITLNDKRDSTPYWLISCTTGAKLKSAIEAQIVRTQN